MPDHTLEKNEAHLWYVRPQLSMDDSELQQYREFLTDEEREAIKRFRSPEDRRDRLVARILVRSVLSLYTDVPAAAWRFRAGPHGKPEIDSPTECRLLRFSLSHTNGLIACIISADRDVGVDVECVNRIHDFMDIAARVFSFNELSVLETLSQREQRIRFFELWTLKESYAKARGLGLSIPFDAVSFELAAGPVGRVRASFDPRVSDNPSRWQFGLEWLDDAHVIATSVLCGTETDVSLKVAPMPLLKTP
jgi:4'-phosphopantetheinyl transferase